MFTNTIFTVSSNYQPLVNRWSPNPVNLECFFLRCRRDKRSCDFKVNRPHANNYKSLSRRPSQNISSMVFCWGPTRRRNAISSGTRSSSIVYTDLLIAEQVHIKIWWDYVLSSMRCQVTWKKTTKFEELPRFKKQTLNHAFRVAWFTSAFVNK